MTTVSSGHSPVLTQWSAEALSRAIHARAVSCREVMEAFLSRIDHVNPRYNAIISRVPHAHLIAQATQADQALARGQDCGWLHGIPLAVKDLSPVAGMPMTSGSVLLKDFVPTEDSLMVARMRAAGCLVVGKTNVPEFGLGSHTFNGLFGATSNAWDPHVTAGGSSGGTTVALAQRLMPLGDGSDFMGSLRNPAAWANVFGMRPSQGLVPMWPAQDVFIAQLGTEGPMARDTTDLRKLLAIQAGYDARSPLSLNDQAPSALTTFDAPPDHLRGVRVGWLGDLQGYLATEPGLLQACEAALSRMQAAGAVVEVIKPAFNPAEVWDAWLIWRRALVAPRVAPLLALPDARAHIKPEALWEYDQGQGLKYMDFYAASAVRTRFYQQIISQLKNVDLLALPVTQVWPFDKHERWPKAINGRTMDTYHRWMEATIYATFSGLPALSVPAGFHANGRWPVGLQWIGQPRGDAALLDIAARYEPLISDWLARQPESASS